MPRLISIITMIVFYYRLSVYITVYKLIFFLFISFTFYVKDVDRLLTDNKFFQLKRVSNWISMVGLEWKMGDF